MKREQTAFLVLLLAALATGATAQQKCVADYDPSYNNIPPLPQWPIGADVDATFGEEVDSPNCTTGCSFSWDVEVEWTYSPLPMPPGNVLVCAEGPGLFCSEPALEVGSGGPPFLYYYESETDDFKIECLSALTLSIEWYDGLGWHTLVEIEMACGACLVPIGN